MLKSYFKKIFEVGETGDAREESYYSTLVDLLNTYAESINKKNIHITTLPKKTEGGNPDFRIWDGKQHIVGYIEAKSPTVKYLDQIETTDQLKRYSRHEVALSNVQEGGIPYFAVPGVFPPVP